MQNRSSDSAKQMKNNLATLDVVRWLLLVLFAAAGLYLLAWAFQSASFSVPTEPLMSEIYKTQALLLLPLSLLFFAVGILFLSVWGKRHRETSQASVPWQYSGYCYPISQG